MSGVSPGPNMSTWKDCMRTVANGGCYASAYGTGGGSFGANWGITFGTNGTIYSSGYILLRITTNAAINMSQITVAGA